MQIFHGSLQICPSLHAKTNAFKEPAHYWTEASLILSADLLPWGNTVVMADGSEFDLDYITERIIGITFHYSCTEQMYQHNLHSITQMLQSKHADRYMVRRPEKQTNQLSLCVCWLDWLLLLGSHGIKPLFSCMQVINLSEHNDDLSRMNYRVKLNSVSCDC